MCSVCGLATDEPDPKNVPRVVGMLQRTRHRGPDACGVHAARRTFHAPTPEALLDAVPDEVATAADIVLGQSRLTITGGSSYKQPLVSDDGKIAFAHNGEFYNHQELADLVGLPLGEESDSSIALKVLEHHYEATRGSLEAAMTRTVAMVSGMYSIAATDGERVVLARDAIGKKPLYYVDGDGTFAWASERKALIDIAAGHDAAIRRVLPGQMVVWEPGLKVRTRRVERMTTPPIDILDNDVAVAEYEDAIRTAVKRRTRGVAKAACFFSGGVDSVMVAKCLMDEGVEVTGYVAGLDTSGDVANAKAVAEEIGLPLKVVLFDPEDVGEMMPTIVEATELHGPLMCEVSLPMWYCAKAAHEDGHRIVFTGQGADEIMGGYDWYRDVIRDHGHLTLHARLWEDIYALPLDCLEREDRVSMHWSLEMRAPFLDSDVIRTAMRISPKLKVHDADDRIGKHPHRQVALRVGVPHGIAYRTKVPAQEGASVHELLQEVAAARVRHVPAELDVPDFGSLYRYRETLEGYTSPQVRALLQDIVENGEFVVSGEDGAAHAPETLRKAREAELETSVQK